jgi:hypothetical protein
MKRAPGSVRSLGIGAVVVGARLSMPITVMLLLLFSSSDETRWLARLIGSATAPTAGAAQPPLPLNDTLAAPPRR